MPTYLPTCTYLYISTNPAPSSPGTILDLPYCLSGDLSGPLYQPDTESGTLYCVSAALDNQSAYETAEGGVCTRAFLGSYKPGQSPGMILKNMRSYAEKKGMPQTIAMHSNKEFKDGDASFIEGVMLFMFFVYIVDSLLFLFFIYVFCLYWLL